MTSSRDRSLAFPDQHGKLRACPATPNCVCSDDVTATHAISALFLAIAPDQAWRHIVDTVSKLARTRIVTQSDAYLHAECRSALFGFVDDLELQLRTGDRLVAVRSASRLGYYDFGVNRRRIEHLRAILTQNNILLPAH